MAFSDELNNPRGPLQGTPRSGLAIASTRTLAVLRTIIGITSLITPNFAGQLSGLPPCPDPTVTRLVGARDVVVGLLLLAADRQNDKLSADLAAGEAGRSLARALWVGILIDSIDAGSVGVGILQGTVSTMATWIVGFGAVCFAGMGLCGLS